MLRIILGAVVGFIVWTVLLFITDAIWAILSPEYVKHQASLQKAILDKTQFDVSTFVMGIATIRSALQSFLTGILAALISKESFKSPLLLGIFLLAFGLFIHSLIWNNVPIWYHILILLPLIPLTILGGKLAKQSPKN